MKHAKNRKVPRKRKLSKGTYPKNQLDPITDYLQSQGHLIERGISGLNRLARVCCIELEKEKVRIQLTERDFRRLFGEQQRRCYFNEYDYMFTDQGKVEFFCLVGRK